MHFLRKLLVLVFVPTFMFAMSPDDSVFKNGSAQYASTIDFPSVYEFKEALKVPDHLNQFAPYFLLLLTKDPNEWMNKQETKNFLLGYRNSRPSLKHCAGVMLAIVCNNRCENVLRSSTSYEGKTILHLLVIMSYLNDTSIEGILENLKYFKKWIAHGHRTIADRLSKFLCDNAIEILEKFQRQEMVNLTQEFAELNAKLPEEFELLSPILEQYEFRIRKVISINSRS